MTDRRSKLLVELEVAEKALADGAALVASLPDGSRQEKDALDNLVGLQQAVLELAKLLGGVR